MNRREFMTLIGSAAAAWPLAALAQQAGMTVIGFLHSQSPAPNASEVHACREGLSPSGFVEGHNVSIEYRWAESQSDRLPALAADLVRRQVTMIVAGETGSAVAATAATTTIPIVFRTGADPAALGLVGSLSQPGGNATGVTTLNREVMPKRLELLHELVPAATIIALLVNPTAVGGAETQLRDVQAAARTLGLQLHVLHANTGRDIDSAFT